MIDQTPAAVAVSYFDALGRGDVPTAMAMLSPEVVWHQPGDNRFSGDHAGIDGVGALLGGMMETSKGHSNSPLPDRHWSMVSSQPFLCGLPAPAPTRQWICSASTC